MVSATLRANLAQQETSRAFLEALRALQHRSLLETAGDGFTLQNVLIEYMTERLVAGVCAELLEGGAQIEQRGNKDSPTHPLTRSMLNRFALLKAQAREYVRQSQVRLIVQPIADQLVAKLGKARLAAHAQSMLAALRAAAPLAPGYLAGNLLNLLLHLKLDVSGYDFSRLSVWQADLRWVAVADVNFAQADLRGCAFTLTINTFAIMIDRLEQMLIAAPVHGDVCLWKVANGQLHDAFRTPSKGAAPLVFSQDGQFLAGCCLDHTVRLWSVETGATLQIFQGHTAIARALTFSDDAQLLASSSQDNTIRLWDVRTGRCLWTLSHPTPGYAPLAFRPAARDASPRGALLLASGGGEQTICLWDIERGQVVDILRGHTPEIENLAFSPDRMLLASGSHDGTILLWDVSVPGRSQLLATLQGHSHVIRALVFHPHDAVLASGSADCTIRLWDCRDGQARQILLGHTSEVTQLAFNADGQVLASCSADRMIRRWDVQTGRTLDSLNGYIDAIHAVHFRPDGRQLASGGADGMIRLWDRCHGRLERSFHGHAGQVLAVAFSPDAHLLASAGIDGVIQLWDAASGQSLRTLRGHTGAVKSLAFHPAGQLLASGSADHTIRLWPITEGVAFTGSGARILRGHTDDVTSVAFSPDGRVLASGSSDHTIRLWAVDRGEQIQNLTGHTAALTAAAFSPDGARIASISYDNTLRVWDVATGRSSVGWEDIRAGGRVVLFSPQGELLAHGVEEVMLVVRDVRTGNVIHTLQGHTSTIVGLHFSPTESILASSGWDGTIRIWDVESGACLHTLRAPGPYAGMNIADVRGISDAQKAALVALGAVELDALPNQALDASPDTTTGQASAATRTPAPVEPARTTELDRPVHRSAPPHNLPASLTPFLGREDELAQLAALLDGDARLITVVGAGGAGKTRLALELARARLPTFADGVYFVALAPLASADALLSAIVHALDLRMQGGDLTAALVRALRDKQVLLVLDNFEHLLDGAGLVVEILQAAPQLRIVATSRERLNVHGEQRYVLQGMAYETDTVGANVAGLAAVRLFAQNAQRVWPGFSLSQADLADVLRICQLTLGMPLGLELAAAWVGMLPLAEIATQIERSADFLATDMRDLPERQRSMRAVFDWSWRLLRSDEQRILRQLTVFRGGFSIEAAQAVAGAILPALLRLVEKSLLLAGAGRYDIHELLRQFAAEQLDAANEHAAVRRRHAAYYLTLAEAETTKLAGPEQAAGLEMEHDNLRAALAWARESGEIAFGLQLAGALWPFWQRRCHLIEGRRWLEGFLAAPGAEAVAREVRATALIGTGWLAHDQDDFVHADALFEEGLRLERALGRTGRVAEVLAHRAVMARGQGQYAQAMALAEESLALARATGDLAGVAYGLFRLGLVTRERSDFARATSVYQECLAAYRALGDRSGAAFALLGLGDIARDQGDAAQLEAYCAESLAICRELGQHWGEGFSLNNLALAATMRGDLARAEVLAEEALALFRAQGIRGGVVELLIIRGQIACAGGNYERAQATLMEGVAQGWPGGPHWLVATGLEELARVAVAQEDAAHAVRLCAAAAAWRAAMDAPLQPYRRAAYEAALAAARHALGEDGFATVWAEGATWRPEQAVAAALAAAAAVPGAASRSVSGPLMNFDNHNR